MNNSDMTENFLYPNSELEKKDRWLLTFADLLSLILTFFVLLFSMSEINTQQWTEISKSLSQKLNPNIHVSVIKPSEILGIQRTDTEFATSLDYLSTILKKTISDAPELKDIISINYIDQRVIISINRDSIFKPQQAEISPIGRELLGDITEILLTLENHIDIYGSASTNHDTTQDFPSNWDLALGRAIIISKHLRNEGYQYNITPYGRADSVFESLSTLSKEEKQKLYKTIDIVIRNYAAN